MVPPPPLPRYTGATCPLLSRSLRVKPSVANWLNFRQNYSERHLLKMGGTKPKDECKSTLHKKGGSKRGKTVFCFLFILYSFALTFFRCFFLNLSRNSKKCIFLQEILHISLQRGLFLRAVAEFPEELAAKYWIELATVVHFTF